MRPRILIGVDWFLPAFRAGGPIRSVANLVDLLAAHGHDVWILTGAYDLGDSSPLPVPTDSWSDFAPHVKVRYLLKADQGPSAWQTAISEVNPSWIYLNSVYSKPFAIDALRVARQFAEVRVVLAPRGMLGAGALSIKPLKKRAFLFMARLTGLLKGVRWHASTEYERAEVLQWFPGSEVQVASNLPSAPPAANPGRPTDQWILVNIGRIHKVKNTLLTLTAVMKADCHRPTELHFIGPPEDMEYMQSLQAIAVDAPSDLTIRFLGAIPPHELGPHFDQAHFLISTTTQENFGHSIAEAWAHGCPTLIADTTPWRGLEEKGVGRVWSLKEAEWVEGLSETLAMSPDEWRTMSAAARAFFDAEVRTEAMREANLRIFQA